MDFKARHENIYRTVTPMGKSYTDLRGHAADILNTSWYYSWSWGKKQDWVLDAIETAQDRIRNTVKELEELRYINRLLHDAKDYDERIKNQCDNT
jgi:hypothetical protein